MIQVVVSHHDHQSVDLITQEDPVASPPRPSVSLPAGMSSAAIDAVRCAKLKAQPSTKLSGFLWSLHS